MDTPELPAPGEVDASEIPEGLTPDQVRYIGWLATPRSQRSPRTEKGLAKEMGIDPSTLWRWRQIPRFLEHVRNSTKQTLGAHLPEVLLALAEEAAKGSSRHQKLYFELMGMGGQEGAAQPTVKIILGVDANRV
jgi:hypothetical protein